MVVIGAGLAGLSAANHLIKNGFTRTILLEAKERCGGRVISQKLGDSFCELGAKWVNIDSVSNSAYEVITKTPSIQKKLPQRGDMIYVSIQGDKLKNPKFAKAIELWFSKLCLGNELEDKLSHNSLMDLNNVHSYFRTETERIISSHFKVKEDIRMAKAIFEGLAKNFAGILGCSLEYVNIEHIMKAKNCNMDAIYIPTGLDNCLKPMTQHLEKNNIKTGMPVGEIRWYPKELIKVNCLDGSSFSADHIICTLPLGVLKNFAHVLFTPNLPENKKKAIKNLGFGNPVKIYFEYEKNVKWFKNNIRPLWQDTDRVPPLKWIRQVVEISKLPSSSRVIEIQIGGGFYEEIEKLPDIEILKEVTNLMRCCFRNIHIPFPSGMLRSNWSSCACFLGGRPYFGLGSNMSDIRALAAPLKTETNEPVLLFAGDATIEHGFGTINGARLSGIREAERIIRYYQTSTPEITETLNISTSNKL